MDRQIRRVHQLLKRFHSEYSTILLLEHLQNSDSSQVQKRPAELALLQYIPFGIAGRETVG